MAPAPPVSSAPQPIDLSNHTFAIPIKRIHVAEDVPQFLSSPAYNLVTSFILHLNAAVSPLDPSTNELRNPQNYTLTSPTISISPQVGGIIQLLNKLEGLIEQAPPDSGPRRFGNIAFRTWHSLVGDAFGASENNLLDQHLPESILSLKKLPGEVTAKEELRYYLAGSFGSPQRLDYGTGHELSFTAFLGGIWVLGGFQPGRDEVALALKCYDAYFRLVRKLVTTYTLEPAGSHGVWGLDDHSFVPYIFGSSELTTHLPSDSPTDVLAREGVEGLEDVPKPGDIVKSLVVERERLRNLYFGAVGFIYDVKTGPFWEHSPILYDISGVQGGWGKINKGMLKMFNAEVLGKFPVVQHFPFGSIFSWDGAAVPTGNQTPPGGAYPAEPGPQEAGSSSQATEPVTQPTESGLHINVAGLQAAGAAQVLGITALTAAPWARNPAQSPTIGSNSDVTTSAPWAKPPPSDSPAGLTASRFPPAETIPTACAAPQPPTYPTSVGLAVRPLPDRQPSREEAKAPWATSEADKHPPSPDIIQATQANLGPRRTTSPDSMLATMEGEEGHRRRGSLGTGGVRVAETGYLGRR